MMRRHPTPPRLAVVAVAMIATVATGCSSVPSESPWATDRDIPDLPDPDDATTDPAAGDTDDGTATGAGADGPRARLIDRECSDDAIRCGVSAVPQIGTSPDLVTLEFRVITDEGTGTPVVVLLDGGAEMTLDAEDLPDRPIIVIGNRGVWPGEPSLSCPEFYDAVTNADVGALLADCARRLQLAAVDPAGTLPSQAGVDVGLTLDALGYREVDLVVPSWRALSTPHIATHVDLRRIVYSDPWFATDRAIGAAASAVAAIDAVWARCRELASCTASGSVDDFLAAVAGLDARPLDDVADTFSDEPRPLDALRVAHAIVSTTGASDLAFLPRLHAAILERDDETVSAFVQAAASSSAEVNLLGLTCSLFDPTTTATGLPAPLRADAEDGIDLFGHACDAWPSEAVPDGPPLPGLSVFTLSSPVDGADHLAALAGGPVIVEPTIGPPTGACVLAAAVAWFDREAVDDGACTTPLAIGDRAEAISLTRGVYDAGDVTIELEVPDTWSDSGYGIWWREADPLDATNLDVYVWDADDAEAARRQIAGDWGLLDPELSSTQVGDRVWLLAEGSAGLDTVFQIATSHIEGENIAVILESEPDEAGRLADEVLVPALAALVVS